MARLSINTVATASPPPTLAAHVTKLTTSRLKELLLALGEPQSGTKKTLQDNLRYGLSTPKIQQLPRKPTRVLSIDMGIRNLAFCVLDADVEVKRSSDIRRELTDLDSLEIYQNIPHVCERVSVVAWKRLSLLDAFRAAAAKQESSPNEHSPKPNEDGVQAGRPMASLSRSKKKSKDGTTPVTPAEHTYSESTDQKIDYSPAVMAQVAYKLIVEVFLPLNISHVVIEKQRHRSGGASAVLEWTIRVNRLESMLHAIFETLRSIGGRNPAKEVLKTGAKDTGGSHVECSLRHPIPLSVTSVDPKAVNRLWFETLLTRQPHIAFNDTVSSASDTKSGNTSAVLKRRKIEIAEGLINGQSNIGQLPFDEPALPAKRQFLKTSTSSRTRNGTRSGTATVGSEDKKRDDLADCLLQGFAWVQWELSRRTLAPLLLEESTRRDEEPVQQPQPSTALDLPELWPKKEA